MEFENLRYIKDEVKRDSKEDRSGEALEVLQSGIDFLEQHPGEIGGIILALRPTRNAKDKHVLCAVTGTLLGSGEMLLTMFQELFEKMEPDMIAFFLNEFLETIPDDKRMEVLDCASDHRLHKLLKATEELFEKMKGDLDE
ncbi:MAG: hypothetical protein J5601_01335 [Elusimicrobiaceae bacterium]|nr:hypothetical protein [Elusimicrobiaceae bacterium]